MDKHGVLLADAATFAVIAAVAALFGFSQISPEVTGIGRTICGIATTWVGVSLKLNRPSLS